METILIGLILLIALLWHLQMKARETTVATARRACDDMGVPLLDDTVALTHMGLKRDAGGRLRIRRIYAFEFADEQVRRRQATVILLGDRVESLLIDGGGPPH